MTTPNPSDDDPRMQEPYMKPEIYEKIRTDLTQIETLFAKVKDGVFYYPKAIHPMAVASKELITTLDQLFPKDSPYTGVASVFNTAFSGLVAIYNETVNKGKNAVDSANKWFEYLRKAKNLIIQRDKYKKEYDHYLKKTTKMRVDREMKKARNPTAIETAKDNEWHMRNDRKLDNSRNNFIDTSQQSYSLAKECIRLRYEYMTPVLDNFSKSLMTFFKSAANTVTNLPEVGTQIEKGKQLQKEQEAEERVKELRVEEEKLRKIQEEKEKVATEKLEKEKAEQARIKKELEEKEKELRARNLEAEAKLKSYDTPNPASNYENSYYPAQEDGYQDHYSETKSDPYHTPRPPRPDYYFTQEAYQPSQARPRPSYNRPNYSQPRAARPRPQESYYDEGYDSYYEPQHYKEPPQENYYTQSRPRPRVRPPPQIRTDPYYAPTEYYQEPSYNNCPAPEPLQTYTRPPRSARNASDDPFADMFDQPQQSTSNPTMPKKPRNPFATGGGYRPPAGYNSSVGPAQSDQFDFLGF
jgi:hypothetical protein